MDKRRESSCGPSAADVSDGDGDGDERINDRAVTIEAMSEERETAEIISVRLLHHHLPTSTRARAMGSR